MLTAIRLDDITINMDWERFRQIEAMLDEFGIKPLIGVVPFPEDDNLDRLGENRPTGPLTMVPMEEWPNSVMKDVPKTDEAYSRFLTGLSEKGWMIALHGYKHVYTTKKMGVFPLNAFSEFAGVAQFDQLNMIKEGLNRLRELGIETDFFMAPGHTYDKNTLSALIGAGITRVTDGFGIRPYARVVDNAGRKEALKFYPISKKRSDCISDKPGYTTLVLHCNTMTDSDIEDLRKMIEKNRDRFMDYSEYIMEGAVPRGFFGNTAEYFMALGKFVYVRIRPIISRSSKKIKKIVDIDKDDDDEFADWVK